MKRGIDEVITNCNAMNCSSARHSREGGNPGKHWIPGQAPNNKLHELQSLRSLSRTISNEKGIALVMVLILSAIALAIMAALVYMLTASTQVSGIQKRYKTALEAGKGGVDVTFRLISARGNPNIPGLSSFNITASDVGAGHTDCLTQKLNSPTSVWPVECSSTVSINPNDQSTYDMSFDLGITNTYRVYSKIVDTVNGNSGGDFGLIKSGVTGANSGEITVMSVPYLYSIEVDAENRDNPQERAKYSVLYEY